MFGQIYLVCNLITGDSYIGLTRIGVQARWREHVYKSRTRPKTYFHRAINKYTPEQFTVEAIASSLTEEALRAAEIELIKDRKPTYNQSHGGEVTTGRKYSDEVLAARNEKIRGQKRTPEQCRRIAEAKRKQFQEDPEARERAIKQIREARKCVDEDKRKAAAIKANTGRAWSEESKAKLSVSCMGRRYGPEVIDKMRRSKMKPIVCPTTNKIYTNAKEAAICEGVGHRSVISVLRGERGSVKGKIFKYLKGK